MPPRSTPGGDSRLALGAGIGCYLIWGFMPLAFQAIGRHGVGSWELLSNRILWGIPAAVVFVLLAGQGREAAAVAQRPRVLAWLGVSSLLIAANWAVFIWAVNSGRLLEGALGYYINPLVSMAGGALVFQERIDRFGKAAIALALVGVAIQTLALGHLPWISIVLALSFGFYGIVRKRVDASAQVGFLVETLVTGLPALAYMGWLAQTGGGHFGADLPTTAWLIAVGPMTATPLVLFSWAARRIPLSVMGFIQFMSPTVTFFIGVLEGEAFTPIRALSFAFIWGGAAVFMWGAWRRSRAVRLAVAEAQSAA